MEDISELRDLVIRSFTLQTAENVSELDSEENLLKWLSAKIEQLIRDDFEGLLFLLYRIDVSEQKIRQMLADARGEGAAEIIASLIIERQKQKLQLRRQMGKFPTTTDDPDRW